MSLVVVLTGLPAAGKTRLALALAANLAARHRSVRVVHTDVLKVALRVAGVPGLDGPGYAGAAVEKRRALAPVLASLVERAERAGDDLVIEGTLAVGFAPPGCRYAVLELDEATRAARESRKPEPARRALASADLRAFARGLRGEAPDHALWLDAATRVRDLVERVLHSPLR